MNKNYILSIIIPTRNRQEYAYSCVNQVLESTSDNVQIVIQDNSDDNSLFLRLKDSSFFNRIKYKHTSEVLSFVANFSQAVELADGEYLCIIGDDDGVNPEIEKFVFWASENKIEAITPEIRLNYIWPKTGIPFYKNDNGNLMILDFNSSTRFYDSKTELEKLLISGGQNYLSYNMAKIYHGIVKKSAMDKVKHITGNYFGGLSPDIFSSVALSLVIDRVLKVDYPLTIPGVCNQSGSGQSSTGGHIGKLNDAPHFKGHYNYQWSNLVPKFYSVDTIWADSALAALTEMKRSDLIDKFNVAALTAYCNFRNGKYKEITNINYSDYGSIKKHSFFIQKIKLYQAYLQGPVFELFKRIYEKLTRKKGSVNNFEGIEDIKSAQFKVEDFLAKNGKSVEDVFLNHINKNDCF